ncbi:cold shock domain-containing protein [bacterium]|nr:cold shock domain-containing protein [bacterium]
MEIGLIEWYDDSKGFGLLKTADNNKVFLHISNWKDSKSINLENKLPILFKIGYQRNKNTALDCKYFNANNSINWQALFSVKEHDFTVKVKYTEINLLQLTLNSLNSDFDVSIVKEFFIKEIENISETELHDKHNWIYKAYSNTQLNSLRIILLKNISFRINKLSNNQILQFWKEKILTDFEPNDTILTQYFKEIEPDELELMQKIDTRNIIITKKVQNLAENFNLTDFLNFDKILKIIDNEKLKSKLLEDIRKIANSDYLKIINQKINDSTKNEIISISDLKNIITEQPTFLSDDISHSIKVKLEKNIIENCSFRIVIDSWDKNLIELNNDFIKTKVKEQNTNDLEYLLDSDKICLEQIDIVLEQLLKLNEYQLVLEKSKFTSDELFEKYDRLIFNSIDEKEYFAFWKVSEGEILPENYLKIYFNHNEDNYDELKNWLLSNKISNEDAKKILFSVIKQLKTIDDRFDFYTLYYCIKSIITIDKECTTSLISLQNPCISLILWHLQIDHDLDFEILKGKFIYFKPKDQVSIFKRLFYLKRNQQIDFDIEKLDEILRADLDLYLANEKFNNDFVLDISTHIIIECLKSYVKTGDFIFESDLILKDLGNNSKKKFKIEHYFDKCEGRLTADWDWNTEGKISKITTNSNGRTFEFFKVVFKYDQDIVESLKKLPYKKRKYYPDKQYWGVSLSCETELFQIANKHRLFINLPNNQHYDNNLHLVNFTRKIKVSRNNWKENIPNGIVFCEGRKAKKEHNKFKKEFWWCANQECFENCVQDHSIEKNSQESEENVWEQYTFLDFLRILNISVDEENGFDQIKDGKYYKLLGHLNAFNRLLEKLYCTECNKLIYPKNTAHFALFRDVRFYCIEDNCSKKHEEIYLTNCLYGECKTIIDSRISKRCKHGLVICHNCGSCCSEDLFKRRLANLNNVGGYVPEGLLENVERQNGHLEKKEYYCYKCSDMMTEINESTYQCSECSVEYKLDKFKWLTKKWTQINRRRKDYPIDQ